MDTIQLDGSVASRRRHQCEQNSIIILNVFRLPPTVADSIRTARRRRDVESRVVSSSGGVNWWLCDLFQRRVRLLSRRGYMAQRDGDVQRSIRQFLRVHTAHVLLCAVCHRRMTCTARHCERISYDYIILYDYHYIIIILYDYLIRWYSISESGFGYTVNSDSHSNSNKAVT